jgi:hypothetical protein
VSRKVKLFLVSSSCHVHIVGTDRFCPERSHDLRYFWAHVFVQIELHMLGLKAGIALIAKVGGVKVSIE